MTGGGAPSETKNLKDSVRFPKSNSNYPDGSATRL